MNHLGFEDSMVLEFNTSELDCSEDVQFDSSPEKIDLNFGSDIRPIIGGVSDYNGLSNRPKINGVILEGNKTSDQIGISRLTNEEIEEIFKQR